MQSVEGVDHVGAFLREARENTGRSIADVAQTLRIRRVYLEAIEDGRFDELPGAAYAVGFVRSYATYLRLDVPSVVARFKEEASGIEAPQQLDFPTPVPEGRFPGGVVVTLCILIAAAGAGGWYWYQNEKNLDIARVPPPPDMVTGAAEAPVAAPVPATSTPIAEENSATTQAAAAPEPATTDTAAETPVDTPTEAPADAPGSAAESAALPDTAPSPAPASEASAPEAPAAPSANVPELRPAIDPLAADSSGNVDPSATGPADTSGPTDNAVADPVPARDDGAPAAVVSSQTPPVEPEAATSGQVTTAAAPAESATTDKPTPDPAPAADVAAAPEPSAPATPAAPAAEPAASTPADTPAQTASAPPEPAQTQAAGTQGATAQSPDSPAVAARTNSTPDGPARRADSPSAGLPAIPTPPSTTDALNAGRTYGLVNRNARIVLAARNENTWVQVMDSQENALLTQMLRPGDRYLVPNRPGLSLRTNNAGGLEISVDGSQVPDIGQPGDIRREVRLDPELLKSGSAVIR